jgi:hypothetical protein
MNFIFLRTICYQRYIVNIVHTLYSKTKANLPQTYTRTAKIWLHMFKGLVGWLYGV